MQFNAADMPAVLASMGLGAGGAGGGFGMPAAPSPVADPETTYAAQIEQLEGMGFWDRQANVQVRSELRLNTRLSHAQVKR